MYNDKNGNVMTTYLSYISVMITCTLNGLSITVANHFVGKQKIVVREKYNVNYT